MIYKVQSKAKKGNLQKLADIKEQSFSSGLITIHQDDVVRDLDDSYLVFQNNINLNRSAKWLKTKKYLNRLTTNLLTIMQQLWRQIVPSYFRDTVKINYDSLYYQKQESENILFDHYKLNKKRFFIIVFEERCDQESVQQAYIQSSCLGTEGFGINLREFIKSTFCLTWKIDQFTKFEKYIILFMKFNIFGDLIYFGNLTDNIVEMLGEDQLKEFKAQLTENINNYEAIQDRFKGSAVAKQDKILFQ